MARRRRYSTDSSDEVKGRNTKRSRPKTPEPNATGRKTFGAETTRRKVPASKTIDAKKSTVPKTTGLKSTEADTKRPDISKSKRNSAAPATSGYSRRQLLALQAPQDGSRDEMNANRSKSIGSVHAGMTNPPHDLEHLFPQAEVLRAMLPGFHFYLEIYEKRTHTEGKHDQDYPNLVRDFQRTMTPLFQKYLSDRAEQLIEEESGLQLVGKEALGPNKQGNTSGFSLKGRVAGGDEVPAVGLEVDRPGAVLSLENQLPQIFAQDTPNNGVENAWIWNSDLLTTSNDTGNFGRLAFFAGLFIYLDEVSLKRLRSKDPGRPCRLLETKDVNDLQELASVVLSRSVQRMAIDGLRSLDETGPIRVSCYGEFGEAE